MLGRHKEMGEQECQSRAESERNSKGKSGRKKEECPRNEALIMFKTFLGSKTLEGYNPDKEIRTKINNIQLFRCQKKYQSYWC